MPNKVPTGRRTVLRHISATLAIGILGTGISHQAVAEDSDPLMVTYFYNYSAVDGGWNQTFYNSQGHLQEKFGDKIKIEFKENVPEGPQSRRIIESAIQNGSDILVSSSFGFGEAFEELAQKHPDVYFVAAQWDSPNDLPNVVGFDNAPEDGAYVAGVAAGHIIEPGGTVGWVDAFPIPYDVRTLNGFALGLAHSNPSASIQVVFTNNWSDSNLYARATRSLIDAGASFIATSIANPSIPEVAESAGVPVFATGVNIRPVAPNHLVTSNQYDWGPTLATVVESIIDDTFAHDYLYARMQSGGILLAPWGGAYDGLSDEAKQDIKAEFDRIQSGDAVFKGPLQDKAGNMVLAEGEEASLGMLAGMNFVVANVNGGGF